MVENGFWCRDSGMLDYIRWNGNDSLLISVELCFMNGNESLIDEILSWLFIVTPLDWYPSWFSSRRHGSSIYGRCTGVWSYFAIGRRHGLHRPWLRCCHMGLANPNMVASCHIREYLKSNKRRKMVKALRSTSKWEIVGVDTYIVEWLLLSCYVDIDCWSYI